MSERKSGDYSAGHFNKLLKKISEDDENALKEFFDLYGGLIYAAALAVSGSSELSKEVTTEMVAEVWIKSRNLTAIKRPVTWLYTVVVNYTKNKLRAIKSCEEIFEVGHNDSEIERINENDAFYHYMKFLDENERQIMILRFVVDQSFKDIAKELHMSFAAVRSTYYRAIKKIKEKFDTFETK